MVYKSRGVKYGHSVHLDDVDVVLAVEDIVLVLLCD